MAWCDGMLFEEIEQHLVERTAPGSDVPGGFVEVPNGYLRWMGNRLRESDKIAEGLKLGITVDDRRMSFAKAFRRLVFHLSKAEELASPTLREAEQKLAADKAVREARVRWETEHAPVVASLQKTITRLSVEVERERLAAEAKEATISMAVARLGGMVEGQPTHRINFLQRIDELVALEHRVASLSGAGNFIAPASPFEALIAWEFEPPVAFGEVVGPVEQGGYSASVSRAFGGSLRLLVCREHHATLQEGDAGSRLPEASADPSRKPPTSGSAGESG